MRKKVMDQLRRAFRPEFLNRVSATIVFRSLTRSELTQIVDLELNKVRERLSEHALVLDVTEPAKELLGNKGYDPEFGARPLRRVITNMVEDRLSDGILAGTFKLGSTVHIDAQEGELVMNAIETEAHPAPDAATEAASPEL
jgi:ATP-dependent Clp protease ATP-binding subunit ClpC